MHYHPPWPQARHVLWWTLFVPATGWAGPAQYGDSREACRRAVTGHYLQLFDAARNAKDFATDVRRKLTRFEEALVEAQARLAGATAAMQMREFDLDAAAERKAAEDRVHLITDNITRLRRILAAKEAEERRSAAESEAFRSAAERIFAIEVAEPTTPDSGYTITFTYRSPCPKFRVVCPLPKADAKQLRDLTLGTPAYRLCKTYSQIGHTEE